MISLDRDVSWISNAKTSILAYGYVIQPCGGTPDLCLSERDQMSFSDSCCDPMPLANFVLYQATGRSSNAETVLQNMEKSR